MGAEYPPRLRDLSRPPSAVYVTGELPRGPAVAIVGTRTPSAEGALFAFTLARDLAAEGVVVMSGGAAGIDTAAHRGALDARSGPGTVVVAPSSFDHPYPVANGRLFEQIVEQGGAHLATRSERARPQLHHFFERNAVLAALVDALVVVETRFRGGARNAAKAARRLRRPVLVVPGAPWVPNAGGCLLELKAGATVVTGADDVLRALGLPSRQASRAACRAADQPVSSAVRPLVSDADPERGAVLQVLGIGPQYPDELCLRAGLPAPVLQALLLTLTLEGIVVSEPSGRVCLANY